MSGYFVKNPGSVTDFTFDWSMEFVDSGATITADLGWLVHPVEAETDALAIQSQSHTPTTTTVFLQGGVAGHAYRVSSRVLTSQGHEIERALTVRIAHT